MDQEISRSAKKRKAKEFEALADELVALADRDLQALPAGDPLKQEIALARTLKGGARKRQIKHLASELRRTDPTDLLTFLARRKGSQLKEKQEFHELEALRDAILSEAIEQRRSAEDETGGAPSPTGETIRQAAARFPGLDRTAIARAAGRYAATRKLAYAREIFRALRAAMLRQRFSRPNSAAEAPPEE